MSIAGAIANFTEAEKQKFRPLYVQYITKQLDDKELLAVLEGDEDKYKKFQDYTAIMIRLLTPKQSNTQPEEPIERRVFLVKQITEREAAVTASKTNTAVANTKHARDVNFKSLKC